MKKLFIILVLPFIILFTCSFKTNTKSSYIVLESSSLRVLKGENINEQMLVASTAKILTAITVIENYSLDEDITITKEYTSAIGSSVYLRENDKISRRELLYALMLRSANDAAAALSDNDSNNFIMLMNETAKKIGMKDSIFTTASGLDEREYNLSTAYDMAILSAYASNNEIFKEISSTHSYQCKTENNSYSWHNKHKLVNSTEGFVWGKTGYTKKAHRILVSNYVNDNMDVIVVTINDSNDWSHHKDIVNNLEEYTFFTIFEKGVHSITLDKEYYLIVDDSIIIPILDSELNNTTIKFRIYKDTAILDVYLYNKLICSKNVNVYDKKNMDIDLLMEIYT